MKTLLLVVLFVIPTFATSFTRSFGYCEKGGVNVSVPATPGSTAPFQASYPQCTVSVYQTGTQNLATLFSDNSSTPLSNPFTADLNGFWFFYTANGRYDLTFSGSGINQPYTWSDYSVGSGVSVVSPIAYASAFVFPAQQPGTPITGGVSTPVTFSPVPVGVNGTDTKHYLYVSGGTGPSEACLISGGSGTSGSSTGIINLICPTSHSGPYSISTATAGMTEAEYSLPTTGGIVQLTANITTFAPIPFNRMMTFKGAAGGSWITPSFTNPVIFDSNLPLHATCPSDNCAGVWGGPADKITFQDLVLNGQTANGINNFYGIRHLEPNGATDNEFASIQDVVISNVTCNNVFNCLYLQRSKLVNVDNLALYANSIVLFTDANLNPVYHSQNIHVSHVRQSRNCINNDCSTTTLSNIGLVTMVNCAWCEVSNSDFSDLPGSFSGMDPVVLVGNSINDSVSANIMVNCRVCVNAGNTINYAGVTYYPQDLQVVSNHFDQIWQGGVVTPIGTSSVAPTGTMAGVLISGNIFSNLRPEAGINAKFINIEDYTAVVTITSNYFNNISSGPVQYAVYLSPHADGITVLGNNFRNPIIGSTSIGIFIDATCPNVNFGIPNQDNTFTNYGAPDVDNGFVILAAPVINLPTVRRLVSVVGATPVTTINTCSNLNYSAMLTISVGSGVTIQKSANLHLTSNFGPTISDGTLSLLCTPGNYWLELARAVD